MRSEAENIYKVFLLLHVEGLGIMGTIYFLDIVELHDIDLSLSKDYDG